MGKRIDNDATQEVSSSQLVPPARPPGAPSVPKNDASMWMQSPVSADDFMGQARKPKKKPAAPGEPGRRAVIAVMVVLFLATVGLGGWWALSLSRDSAKSKPATPTATTLPPPATPPITTTIVDAAVAVAPVDAAVAAVADAAAPVGAMALQVDAISAADPAVKKSKKRPTAKKKTAKKKSAKAPKKRR